MMFCKFSITRGPVSILYVFFVVNRFLIFEIYLFCFVVAMFVLHVETTLNLC